MDYIGNLWNSIVNTLFPSTEEDFPLPDPTAAPYNAHPMEVDMTIQPSKVLTDNWVEPPIKIKEVLITIIRRSTESPATTETSTTNQDVHFYSEQTTIVDNKLASASTAEWLDIVTTEKSFTEGNANVYIIVALSLIILISACLAIIMWCKNHRLRAERRNEYPVYAVSNEEYMDPQKLKNVP